MKTLIPGTIKPMGAISTDPLTELLGKGIDRYNKIRDGIMATFKKYDITPIMIYRMANELDCIAMMEYQNALVNYSIELIKGEIIGKQIEFDKWTNVFDKQDDNIRDCWKKIIEIMQVERVKVMEMSRISAELRTSGMENFIQALGNFIENRKQKPEEVSKKE